MNCADSIGFNIEGLNNVIGDCLGGSIDPSAVKNLSSKKGGDLLHIVCAHLGEMYGSEVVHHDNPCGVLCRGYDVVRTPYDIDLSGPPLDRGPWAASPEHPERTSNHWSAVGNDARRQLFEHWSCTSPRDSERGDVEPRAGKAVEVGASDAADTGAMTNE